MSDLFKEKALDWDASDRRVQMSSAIGGTILANIPLHEDMTVMDFGAGTGLLTSHVAPRVKSVTAVDISEGMLSKLAAKPEFQGKVTAVCQDIISQPLDAHYDLIISAMAMHHVEDTNNLFAVFADHLNPGGKIALADLDKEDGSFHSPGTQGIYHHGFDRNALASIVENNGFSDIGFFAAHTIERDGKVFPIFLVTATKI